MNTLVTSAQLNTLLDKKSLLIFDCRFSLQDVAAGRRAYTLAHIPSAYFADMNEDLSTPHIPGKTGRHPLPSRSDWCKKVQSWGISPDLQVVVYDDVGGAGAARLWWMLQWLGHTKVAVLDGGWQAWNHAGLPVTAPQPMAREPSSFGYPPEATRTLLITAEQLDGATQVLLDARELPRYLGIIEPIDVRAGHIPGAVCSPYSANLDVDGKFKSAAHLYSKFAAAHTLKPVVCYCGSGVTACHNVLAMTIAGLPMPALYAGSWSEWITDSKRPVATSQ